VTHLLVQEIKVGGTFVRNVALSRPLELIPFGPLDLAVPVILLVIFFTFVIVCEVGLFRSVLAAFKKISMIQR
jgi:hypothetical protein